MRRSFSLKHDQSGFASMVIALVMIIVLSLLTLGFAQVARREQKSALDKQLATQAYYAAETGINDVIKNLASIPDSPNACIDTSIPAYGLNGSVNASSGVGYTCIMLDKNPSNIVWSNVGANSDRTSRFSTSGPVASFDVMWGATDGSNTPRPAGHRYLPTQSLWSSTNSPAVLKVSLTPFNDSFTRYDIQDNTYTVYLYPQNTGAAAPVTWQQSTAAWSQGVIVSENCAHGGQYPCRVTINVPQRDNYLIRIHNYYDASNIQIGNLRAPLGFSNNIEIQDAQAVIDVTGKSQDVLKRLQVRAPLNKTPYSGDFSAAAQDICKRQETQPGSTSFVGINGAVASGACDLMSD